MALNTYQQLLSRYTEQSQQLQNRLRSLSLVRLLSFFSVIICSYYFFSGKKSYLLILALLFLILFFYLVRLYDQTKDRHEITKALAYINQTEINLFNGAPSGYEGGGEYIDSHHAFSYDLDIFGESSLYQFINRTTTSFGKNALAQSLLQPDISLIRERQQAIHELSGDITFRQQLQAAGILHRTEEKKIKRLTAWLAAPPAFRKKAIYYLLLLFPAATFAAALIAFITENEIFQSIAGLLVVLNLAITFTYARKMMAHISVSADIKKTLQQFSDQIVLIEKQSFQSPMMVQFNSRLQNGALTASRSIKQLVGLFNYLDYLFNIFVSPLLNGLFLFHIHILFSLDKWKEAHRPQIMDWLQVIGEAESISSFATLYYNNQDFSFPDVSATEDFTTSSMGHPLLRKEKRICNDITFLKTKFVVLTGSNMSGKSTFLRTLGINLILARAGSVVCATHFHFYPYEVYVSMRISDSLQDSESFFYAELKRLQTIINQLNTGHKTFVILDEILRGTNSNDKHSGTIGLIRKLVSQKACGIIATHDLSVSELASDYPGYIGNNCFESEIINDELLFDYKLKEGVCTTLSASFLMKKLGIIE